jgi:hypothetical protein
MNFPGSVYEPVIKYRESIKYEIIDGSLIPAGPAEETWH